MSGIDRAALVAMVVHELKCWPEYFGAVLDGSKTFEVRRDDRGFKVGDVLWLREWDCDMPGRGNYFTGREVRKRVTYIMRHPPFVPEGFCIMALGEAALVPPVEPRQECNCGQRGDPDRRWCHGHGRLCACQCHIPVEPSRGEEDQEDGLPVSHSATAENKPPELAASSREPSPATRDRWAPAEFDGIETDCSCLDPVFAASCACDRLERIVRAHSCGRLQPMSEQQRAWCFAEVRSIEGWSDYQMPVKDSCLASDVLSAWRTYAQDKGFIV